MATAISTQPIKQTSASYSLDTAFNTNDETIGIKLIFSPNNLNLALDDAKTYDNLGSSGSLLVIVPQSSLVVLLKRVAPL